MMIIYMRDYYVLKLFSIINRFLDMHPVKLALVYV